MILSMTGYGRAQKLVNGRDISIEIKSVNSRYFEYSSRMPRSYNFLDDKIKKLLSQSISRGKVELGLTVVNVATADTVISPNVEMATGYLSAINEIGDKLNLKNNITADSLARFPDIFTVTKLERDENQLWEDVKEVVNLALENFVAMRTAEGEQLAKDIETRLCFLENAAEEIEKTSSERVAKYTEKLYARLQEVINGTNIDESRILTEAAIFADKTAVDEETVRLTSHFKQYRTILKEGGSVGRKLDFLTQELNRETNTIGSKCNEISITRLVVDMKAEIEKIREQIQNME